MYLNFQENERIRIGKGDVSKTLENPPYFLGWGHCSDAYSCEATLDSTRFYFITNGTK
jgi:hypothetical protein